jgi:hypothetical protein
MDGLEGLFVCSVSKRDLMGLFNRKMNAQSVRPVGVGFACCTCDLLARCASLLRLEQENAP